MDMTGPKQVDEEGFAKFKAMYARNIRPELAGYIGVEVECFLTDAISGELAMASPWALEEFKKLQWTLPNGAKCSPMKFVGKEFFAGQLEYKTAPCSSIGALAANLAWVKCNVEETLSTLGLKALYVEYYDGPLNPVIYPEPRYLEFAATKATPARIDAMCRVAGVHSHHGVRDLDDMLAVANGVAPHTERICRLGDHTGGKRVEAFLTVISPQPRQTPQYPSWEAYFQAAVEHGFVDEPQNNWMFIRPSAAHGTVEIRTYGTTESLEEMLGMANEGIMLHAAHTRHTRRRRAH